MFILLYVLIYVANGQPCKTPIQLIGATAIVGSCLSDVASTTATDFDLAALGGTAVNNGLNKFALTMWVKPNVPVLNGPVYSLFRITTDAADIAPLTPNGVRFALLFHSDSNFFNKGMRLQYSETPNELVKQTDLTQFIFSYTGNKWIFIYSALDYTRGEMVLFAWELQADDSMRQSYSASRVFYNTPLDDNLMINFLYWGQYARFCGQIKKVFWHPDYFENVPDNIRKLPYFMENQQNKPIYDYRFERYKEKEDKNLVTTTVSAAWTTEMLFSNMLVQDSERKITLEKVNWDFADKSFTFSINIMLEALPVSGQDLIIFQRYQGVNNKFAVILARQPSGKIGIVVQIDTTPFVITSYDMNANEWYYLHISIAFPGSIEEQAKTLVHHHLIDSTPLYTQHGYFMASYSGNFQASMNTNDKNEIGSASNTYPGNINFRHMRLQTGFTYFTGVDGFKVNCIDDCYIGQVTKGVGAKTHCLLCDETKQLNTNFLCEDTCASGYYKNLETNGYHVCSECNKDEKYYVNILGKCIQEACPNGFKESTEECDDNNADSGDGCSDTCKLEIGFDCDVVLYEETTCVKLCGNGVFDKRAGGYTEECDDKNSVSGDGCSDLCEIESDQWECLPYYPTVCTKLCGNGKLNDNAALSQTEQCDDANTENGDGCDSNCQIENAWECTSVSLQQSNCNKICGNGKRNGVEECDDGNEFDDDGCTNCVIDAGFVCNGGTATTPDICIELCGNGTIDVANGEACDDGNGESFDGCTDCQVDAGWTCTGTTPTVCKFCGNGKREPGETCDDANPIDNDGCTNCLIDAGWTCNGASPDQCGNCGNGFKEIIENCDDGNLIDDDGCTNCEIDPFYLCLGGSPTSPDTCVLQCPDSIVQTTETCDDGNNTPGDGCKDCQVEANYVCVNQPSVCSLDVCGNGLRNTPTEQCDDGNLDDGDGCDGGCQIEEGWKCRGGGLQTKDSCNVQCGDGIKVVSQEECEDGNQVDDDGCSRDCKIELGWKCDGGDLQTVDTCIIVCGNNERAGKEQCDDGNKRDGDGCSSKCQIETGFGCTPFEVRGVLRDECFRCVKNCAICSDETLQGCSLCHQGFFKDQNEPSGCVKQCPYNTYPNIQTQECSPCSDGCERCFEPSLCFRCASPQVLNGTSCINECDKGAWPKKHPIKGIWCKACPNECLSCDGDNICTVCKDYYSLHPVVGTCLLCNLGDKCLQCDQLKGFCTVCVPGYRPFEKKCLLIEDKCGDGLVSLNEACDDGNIAQGDGCSRNCIIEDGFECKNSKNEGPSTCFGIVGWDFTLETYILELNKVTIHFSEDVHYNKNDFFGYEKLFLITIDQFTQSDFKAEFDYVNNSTLNVYFDFKKNVINQKATFEIVQPAVLKNINQIPVNPEKVSASVFLEDVDHYTDEQIKEFDFYAKVCLILESYTWLLVVAGGFLGSKYRMWHIVEVMQVIATLYFVNIRSYPLNNEMMFEYMQYSNFYLFPNVIEQDTGAYTESLRRFKYAGVTYMTLNNSGGRFLIGLAISLGVYIFVKLVYFKFIVKIFEIFLDKLEFSYFLKYYEVFLLDLLIGSFHNVRFNSMASNWDGTNTVFAFIFLFLIGVVQVLKLLIILFKERFGNPEEVDVMFGTLIDGQNDNTKWRRIFISQFDFIKKFLIAYGIIYFDDNLMAQIYMIIIPRAVLTMFAVGGKILQGWLIIGKEIVTEGLLYGVIGMLIVMSQGSFVSNLELKVQNGWILEYLVIAIMALNGLISTYLIWKLLKDLEMSLPEIDDPSAHLNKKVDLFTLKPKKAVKRHDLFDDDIGKKVENDELNLNEEEKIYRDMAKKNQNREKWNVWNMDREAKPEEQKFVSILHRDGVKDQQSFADSEESKEEVISNPIPQQDQSIRQPEKEESEKPKDDDDNDNPFDF